MFLPTTSGEIQELGWDRPDIVLVSGDTYIDSPQVGIAVIGRVLEAAGFRVAVIAQPETESDDIVRLGEPRLFWGVSGGCVDSLVANYTATGKFRNQDDFTPGGVNNRRPDRACLAYTNLIRRHFPKTVPVVLGGIEASLRRVTHYDFIDRKIRNSILPDAKADYLLYGMAERSVSELAIALRDGKDPSEIRGLCRMSKEAPEGYLELPDAASVKSDPACFEEMFQVFYRNTDPVTARGLVQKHGERYLVQNPPSFYETTEELDRIQALPFTRSVHPYYAARGEVRALETIRFSIESHRGCYGECNFCAIAVHQGRTVRSRSEESILEEARHLVAMKGFKGNIMDVGGPTANMYGIECLKKIRSGMCRDKRCLFPEICDRMPMRHDVQLRLLKKLREIPGVKRVFIGSGIRYDIVMHDKEFGSAYIRELAAHHVSGQLKLAPEHLDPGVLDLMGKRDGNSLLSFRDAFLRESAKSGKEQFLTYYFIAAHPGCGEPEMRELKKRVSLELQIRPEQVQIFTPTPSTWSTVMYWTGKNPWNGKPVFVEKDTARKEKQKAILTEKEEYFPMKLTGPGKDRRKSR
jgi:uncharacterized radical SAM protein YgiQ